MIWCASSSSGAFTSVVADRLGDLCVGVDVLGEIQRLEHERVAAARTRQSDSRPERTKRPSAPVPVSRIASSSSR